MGRRGAVGKIRAFVAELRETTGSAVRRFATTRTALFYH
jgi:hypothetical protein